METVKNIIEIRKLYNKEIFVSTLKMFLPKTVKLNEKEYENSIRQFEEIYHIYKDKNLNKMIYLIFLKMFKKLQNMKI